MTDGSIGFISSEGEVGRIAENLEELLTFLIHAGNLFDFNCKHLYQNPSILTKYCDGYIYQQHEKIIKLRTRTGIGFVLILPKS